MTFLDQITVLILTYNEEENIDRTLQALTLFPEVVVLDSFSTDATLDILTKYPNVRSVARPFDSHAAQWNFGLNGCGIERPWVLALDADYVLNSKLVEEIAALEPDDAICGYQIGFRYCIFGRALRASLYPAVIALYRRASTMYIQDGHTQRAVVNGAIKALLYKINHDDRKPLSRWFSSQQRYAKIEVDHLLSASSAKLRRNDRIRMMAWPAPILVFLYTLIWKRCILDGWRGWLYALQRTLFEILFAIEVIDRRLRQEK